MKLLRFFGYLVIWVLFVIATDKFLSVGLGPIVVVLVSGCFIYFMNHKNTAALPLYYFLMWIGLTPALLFMKAFYSFSGDFAGKVMLVQFLGSFVFIPVLAFWLFFTSRKLRKTGRHPTLYKLYRGLGWIVGLALLYILLVLISGKSLNM